MHVDMERSRIQGLTADDLVAELERWALPTLQAEEALPYRSPGVLDPLVDRLSSREKLESGPLVLTPVVDVVLSPRVGNQVEQAVQDFGDEFIVALIHRQEAYRDHADSLVRLKHRATPTRLRTLRDGVEMGARVLGWGLRRSKLSLAVEGGGLASGHGYRGAHTMLTAAGLRLERSPLAMRLGMGAVTVPSIERGSRDRGRGRDVQR